MAHEAGALRTKDLKRVTVDTTVQPKAVTFPTDARLLHAAIQGLTRLARKHGVRLRQSYQRIAKRAAMMAGRYAHAKQFKRHHRELRILRSRLGRIIRDIGRKIAGQPALEEAFAQSMTALANRRRHRRRIAVTAVVTALAVGLGMLGVLWSRSEAARRRADAEALRAEASKLLALGQAELERNRTAALAYVTKSLELADTEEARLFAVRVLQDAPPASMAIPTGEDRYLGSTFSPNGEWVALGGYNSVALLHRDGKARQVLGDYPTRGRTVIQVRFGPGSDVLVGNRAGDIRVWSVPDGRVLTRAKVDDPPVAQRESSFGGSFLRMGKDGFLTITSVGERRVVRFWPLPSGEPRLLGSIEGRGMLDATGQGLAYVQGRSVYLRSLEDLGLPPRLVAEAPANVLDIALPSDASRVATSDFTNETRIWTTAAPSTRPERVLKSPANVVGLGFDPAGRWVCALNFERGYPKVGLFDLVGPPGASPLMVQKGDTSSMGSLAFDRTGRWLGTAHGRDVAFWRLGSPHPQVLESQGSAPSVQFTPDGKWLVSLGGDRSVWVWPVPGVAGSARIVLPAAIETPLMGSLAVDPSGRLLAVSGLGGRVLVVPFDEGPVRSLPGFPEQSAVGAPAFGEGGRLLAAGMLGGPRQQKLVRVWDLQTGAVRTFGPLTGAGDRGIGGIPEVRFAGPDRLLASVRATGILSLDLASGGSRVVVAHSIDTFAVSRDGRFGMGANKADWGKLGQSPLVWFSLEDGRARPLSSHGADVTAVALDPTDSLVATGSADGTIRVGPVSGGEPHVLLGQEGTIHSVAFSPDGRWLAASGEAFAIRIWPVPDVSRPALHVRPLDELLAVLRGHTNLRAVPDPASRTGYRLEAGPFPGWATPPEW